MKLLKGEEIIWQSKNKNFILTSYRIRKYNTSSYKRNIKSMTLSELDSCELKTTSDKSFIKWAIYSFVLINGIIMLFNQFLFKTKLFNFIFGEVGISSGSVKIIFFLSLFISLFLLINYFLSIERQFLFHSKNTTISLKIKWIDFEKRDSFITMIERQKLKNLNFVLQD